MANRQLKPSDYEELRRRNIADNQIILSQLMKDLQKVMPTQVKPPPRKPRIGKVKGVDGSDIRRNPSRSARSSILLSPPRTRSRRGSMSSAVSSVSGCSSTSPDRMVVKFGFFGGRGSDSADAHSTDGLDEPLTERRRAAVQREEKSAEEITDEDLALVATFVSEKKYDSIYGTSCHQCRQKTDDMKTICRSGRCFGGVRGQFCGPCLRNRYGEDAKEALKDADWECPSCRGICNCSFCRKKAGKSCTGILIHLARENGFSNVNEYLQSLRK